MKRKNNESSRTLSIFIPFAVLMLTICFFSCNSSPAKPYYGPPELDFKKIKIMELKRLHKFLYGVKKEFIYKGMKIAELDKILGSGIEKNTTRKPEVTTCFYSFGGISDSWGLAADYNNYGEILGFYLSNEGKGGGGCEPAKLSVEYVASRFRKSKTQTQKLDCIVKAIEAKAIRHGTKRSDLNRIFGKGTEEKEVKKYEYTALITSYKFGTGEDSWRLSTYGDSKSDYIWHYALIDHDKPERDYQ